MNRAMNRGHSAFSASRKKQNVPIRQRGLTYVEVLIAMLVLVIGLVPAMDAVRDAVWGTSANEEYVVSQRRLASRLEDVLAESFDALDDAAVAAGGPTVPTSYSDPVATPGRLLVFIAAYDGDNADTDNNPFTGTDAGILWVRTSIENSDYILETVTAL